ncbi:hypothetical protein [Bdellovibrio sp.]|uniref:hypothetical protein n=1 Tax=Bdellovibrio sp. TaxID=28201 RepID=UPI0039E3D9EA
MHLRILFLIFFFCVLANGETLPATLRDGSTRFLSRSLGSACYTLDSVERGLPCNPAAVAKARRPRFDADLFMGSRMEYLKDAEEILRGESHEGAVARFFSHRESMEADFSIEASFQAATWGVSFGPYRLVAVSRFENPALPMVDLVIAEEQSVKGQIASYMQDNFYAGVQARYTHVRFIGQYFALSEAFAGDSEHLFSAQTQELFYLEPGFLYAWEEVTWQPQISGMLAHWGVSSQKSEQYPIQPEALLGVSVKPEIPLGLLELGVQLQVNAQTENAREAVRAAAAYRLGILHAVASASEGDHAAGFLISYKSFTGGLSYWTEKDNRGVFMQLGATL